ncbi:Serine carboxypeptidase-like 18 [Heracleum sosnowskyi]|uniref:Serine carboxypeptidase-like 18 n=1 Tax=Heracleum sosnowskyi TaxID=360622 RepID=A0AAD8H2L3_9APIA|nr:Serine carboxypeptidase-like 18 [Heracleum sosnowskyi]
MTKHSTKTHSTILILYILLINLFQLSVSRSFITSLPGFPGKLPFKLETGYVGLGEEDDLQLFYYFVESERNPIDDPLLIWITGGPGCSALRPFFNQLGPLIFDYHDTYEKIPKLLVNPYSWTKVASVIFVDASGSGFSYANTKDGLKTSDTLTSASIYEFLRKWLTDHPAFLNNPLYVSGLSYSGITVPVMVQDIINGNEAGNVPGLNIKGYMIGNPLTDRFIDFNSRIKFAHNFALLSDELYESTKASCNGDYVNVNPANGFCNRALAEVDKCLKDLNEHQILELNCDHMTVLQQWNKNSFKRNPVTGRVLAQLQDSDTWCRVDDYELVIAWATDEAVQKALHVREGTTEWSKCNTDHYYLGRNDTDTYKYDIPSSIAYHRNLTKKNCRALIYSGDHDMVFPYIGTRQWIRTLGLTVDRTWKPWFVKGQVAGYTELFSHDDYSLTYATVKGAGHAAPETKPEQCLAMVDRWFADTRL